MEKQEHDEFVAKVARQISDLLQVSSGVVSEFVHDKFHEFPLDFQLNLVTDLSDMMLIISHSYFHNYIEGAKPEIDCEELMNATEHVYREDAKDERDKMMEMLHALMSHDIDAVKDIIKRDRNEPLEDELASIRRVIHWPKDVV